MDHIIMDATQNYYRTAYRVTQGLAKRLTYDGEEGYLGLHKGDDISCAFYMLRALESSFHTHNADETAFSILYEGGHQQRSEVDTGYKSNREGRLSDEGKQALRLSQQILTEAGYNVYQVLGYEADDIARALVQRYENEFDKTICYTNDADWLVNLSEKTAIMRYKASNGFYKAVTPKNFPYVMEEEYKCEMPFNCILLYKCLVGDKSDNIKGVKLFGPKKFDVLVDSIRRHGQGNLFRQMTDPKVVEWVIQSEKDIISGGNMEKLQQAYDCLELVKPKEVTADVNLQKPSCNERLHEQRIEVYQRLGFKVMAKAW